jgi:hypothetical protein
MADTSFNLVAHLQEIVAKVTRLEARVSSIDYMNHGVPRKDPSGSLLQNTYKTVDASCRVVSGTIIDAMPAYGWYNVQISDSSFIACELISETSNALVGVRRVGVLPPGTMVFLVINGAKHTGAILGSYQGYAVGTAKEVHDFISQASTQSKATENFTQYYKAKFPKISKYSLRSAVDETSIGEWGKMTETGTGLFVDSFMSFLRADENCGFWAFWHDQLARMHGHNLQIRSPGMDIYSFDDEDELSVVTGFAPYLWEALGRSQPGQVAVQNSYEDSQLNRPEFANFDIVTKGQTPFHRLRRFDGFLGQGFKQQLRLPPNITTPIIYSLPTPVITPAVWEEHLALDGNYHMVSAQGIMFAHVPPFSAPNQIKLPEDATGDSTDNGYVPAGFVSGEDSPQKIRTGPKGDSELPGTGPALIADDELAYGVKWRSGHPFYYHKKDWKTFDEQFKEAPQGYGLLSNKQYLPKPTPVDLQVDHRQKADYHPTLSFVSILRDGTVVIAGPAGEEIRMGGGSIEISCPGDIQLRPGRSLINLSGRDTVIRAKNSVEVSSTDEDVRIKSERHMQLLAGNSGVGGMLIESKSQGVEHDFTKTGSDVVSNGIVIKSSSVVSTLGESIYVRAGLKDSSSGLISFDASKGKGNIISSADSIINFASSQVIDYFGKPTKVKAANVYTADVTVIAGGLRTLTGDCVFAGAALFNSYVYVLNGNVYAEYADGQLVGFDEKSKKLLEKNYQLSKKIKKDTKVEGNKAYKQSFTEWLYDEKRIGNSKVLKTAGFSFRSTEQCRVSKFMLYESRWAQRARANGESTLTWTEKPVKANENDTYPYPGVEAWTGSNYTKIDSTLYTNAGGGYGPVAAGPDYENVDISDKNTQVKPNGNYPVIY